MIVHKGPSEKAQYTIIHAGGRKKKKETGKNTTLWRKKVATDYRGKKRKTKKTSNRAWSFGNERIIKKTLVRAGPGLAMVRMFAVSGSAVHIVEKDKRCVQELRQKEASLAFGDGSQ